MQYEIDFGMNSMPSRIVTCSQCGKKHWRDEALHTILHSYCDEECENEHRVKRLREEGL